MRLPYQLLALVATILTPTTYARSSVRKPLGALSPVQNASIHTHNGRVTAFSSFEISFNIRDDLHVLFKLAPNHDILAYDATIARLAPDGTVTSHEPIDRLEHKVFRGSAWVMRPGVEGQQDWRQVGWARVSIRKDGQEPVFEGAFAVNHDSHHVQTSRDYVRTRHPFDPEIDLLEEQKEYMVVWRDSDVLTEHVVQHQGLRRSEGGVVGTCRADGLGFNSNPDHPVFRGIESQPTGLFGSMEFASLFKRQLDSTTSGNSAGVDLKSTIGNPAGCPTLRKVALVGVATDCTYTAAFESDQEARENVISQMNQASAVWESTFNISLGLQNLTVSNSECPAVPSETAMWNQGCSSNITIGNRLNYFSAWRGLQKGNNSHWTLLSTCNTGEEIGLAWLGQACVQTATQANVSMTGNGATSGEQLETVSGANVVVRTAGASEWQVIAHETGHTYGAVHDCTSQTCADTSFVNSQGCCPLSADTCNANGVYIMNPAASTGVTGFSPCTVGNICSAIGRNSVNTACLADNKDVQTITGQVCGNGIVEAGEECDCGGVEGCNGDPCCDPTTCKFTAGSVCDDANENCCTNCQLANNGTICRASTGVCDPQELCTGSSGSCPPDASAPDGQKCGAGLQCASGQCTSRDQQCQSVMGSYVTDNKTTSCSSSGCTISCASPQFGQDVCYGVNQNFLDGTICNSNGRCENGECKGSSVGGEVKSWIDSHEALVIGICVGVGVLLLLCLLSCLGRCLRRRRGRVVKKVPSPPPGGWQGWTSAPPPPPEMTQGWYSNHGMPQREMQEPSMSGGASGGWRSPNVPPPPAFTSRGSVRYA